MNEVSESWNEDWTDWTAESWDDDDYWWTIGGMTNGRRAVMVNGEFRRLGGTMVLDGIATGMDIAGNRNQSKVRTVSVSHDNRSDVQKTGSVGSTIINPLLYDLTCETTGGLRFVHEHDLAVDSPSCGSRCGCNGAELEFADMEN